MKRLILFLSTLLIAAALSTQVHAKGNEKATNSYDDDVWIILYYAAVVDQDPIAEFYLENPEAEGSLEYGDYCYYSYASSKGGTEKAASGSNNGRDASGGHTDEIDILSYSWGNTQGSKVQTVLLYAAVVEQDPIAEFYLENPEADGALEYGDYCYYSYASTKGGTAKASSSSSNSSARD